MELNDNEYNPYYKTYLDKSTKGDNINHSLGINLNTVAEFYYRIPKEKLDYAYEEGKWTPKDILLHLIDTERVFAYRALRVARQDKTAMADFEQDDYVEAGKASSRDIDDLIREYKSVRGATISLFNSFSDEELKSIGTASGSPISVRAIGHIITGHENHHNEIIKERYL